MIMIISISMISIQIVVSVISSTTTSTTITVLLLILQANCLSRRLPCETKATSVAISAQAVSTQALGPLWWIESSSW